jgi:hypothetical protein
MRRIILGLSLAFLLLGGTPALTSRRSHSAQSQEDKPVPIDDSYWQGTVTIEESAKDRKIPNTGTGFHETEWKRKITYTLDRVPRYGDVDEWYHEEVPFVVSGSYHSLEVIPPDPEVNFKGARHEMSDTVSGSGTAEVSLTPEGDDEEKPTKMLISLSGNPDHQKVTIKRHFVTTTGEGTRTWDEELAGSESGGSVVVPYDPDRGVLSGVKTDHSPYGDEFDGNMKGVAETIYSYSLTLSRPTDLEAVIIPLPGYDKWEPNASKTEDTAGPKPLAVKVRLQKKGAPNEPGPKRAKFKFELIDTTKEKGVCLNWPADKAQDTYDLRIERDKNEDLDFKDDRDNEGQKAETKEKKLSEAAVIISCFDWGAYTRLKVTAVLDDSKGTKIPAHLESDKSKYELTIPKDKNDNKIADGWEDRKGVSGQPEDDDSETDPEGDGHPGDGLTLYEEYRGFMENGTHIFGDLKKKDFFICNKIGAMADLGISKFEEISELAVHSKLKPGGRSGPGELDASRIINRNYTSRAHVVDQHGVFVDKGDEGLTSEASPQSGFEPTPGPPKKFEKVKIGLGFLGEDYSAYQRAQVFAHELLHCCSVWHHGDIDQGMSKFQTKTDAAGAQRIYMFNVDGAGNATGPGAAVILINEKTGAIIPPGNPGILTGFTIWIGSKQGQHSGNADCVMRYACAHGYKDNSGNYEIFADKEKFGLDICTDSQGTGVNEPGRKPEPRFGNATAGKGDCTKQICVNDKYH